MELKKTHKSAVNRIIDLIKEGEFYLAGDTAVYYYLNHRDSDELDFFTEKEFDFRKISKFYNKILFFHIERDVVHAEVEGVKISFFYYPYTLLKPLQRFDLIEVASLEDIACMKLLAIIQRGSRKDFTDLYFIIKELKLSPEKLIELFCVKYGNYNPLIIRKSLSFFEDADKEPELKMIKRVNWGEIKKFFVQEFVKL